MSSTPSSSSQGQSGRRAIKTQTKTKVEVKKREVKTGVDGASGSVPAGTSPTPAIPSPQVPAVPAAPSVYKLPSGGTVRLRPRGAEEGEDQGLESRQSKVSESILRRMIYQTSG